MLDQPTVDASQPEEPTGAGPGLLQQLEVAKRELADWVDRFDNYSGNNPDKYQSNLKHARRAVHELTEECKRAGLLPASEPERIGFELDNLYPDAGSRQVVAFEGRYFQKRFKPGQMSNSRKTVTAWDHHWEELPEDHKDVQRLLNPQGAVEAAERATAVKKHWPWTIPAGGLELTVDAGDPQLRNAAAGKTAIGYRKGNADLRVCVRASMVLTEEALERCRSTEKDEKAKRLWLGRNAAGKDCYLVKAGRGSADLQLETT